MSRFYHRDVVLGALVSDCGKAFSWVYPILTISAVVGRSVVVAIKKVSKSVIGVSFQRCVHF